MNSAFCIAGTHSGVGKTTLTLGMLAVLRRRGLSVQPFKCGPDYIDPGHHTVAAGQTSRNLDTWMMGTEAVRATYACASQRADVSVVEGVMGLFDGASSIDDEGSTAHVCRLLDIPIVLVVDAKAMARSIAALVHGFSHFDERLRIAGIIANNVGSDRHAEILRESLDSAGLPSLLGAIPKSEEWRMSERHLGLVTAAESGDRRDWLDKMADAVEDRIDVTALLSATGHTHVPVDSTATSTPAHPPVARLGIAQDEAFQFYYEDNLEMLRAAGIELVPFSPLSDSALPRGLSGLYFGGGYPELYADTLASNTAMREDVCSFAATGASVYGECGGFMYLCTSLTDRVGNVLPMCNLLPVHTRMQNRLRRLGYVEVETASDGLFGPAGTRIRGHEFHWSQVEREGTGMNPLFHAQYLRKSATLDLGVCRGNVSASYVHLHFAANPAVALAWCRALRAEGIPA